MPRRPEQPVQVVKSIPPFAAGRQPATAATVDQAAGAWDALSKHYQVKVAHAGATLIYAGILNRANPRTGTILRNSRGEPRTESGLGSVFQKTKPEGFDRTIHDPRWSFAT